jgi:hypothetical protein
MTVCCYPFRGYDDSFYHYRFYTVFTFLKPPRNKIFSARTVNLLTFFNVFPLLYLGSIVLDCVIANANVTCNPENNNPELIRRMSLQLTGHFAL